jgi:hypothetical protein
MVSVFLVYSTQLIFIADNSRVVVLHSDALELLADSLKSMDDRIWTGAADVLEEFAKHGLFMLFLCSTSLKFVTDNSRAAILRSNMLLLVTDVLKGDESWMQRGAARALAEFAKHGKLPFCFNCAG